jgi:hypothetical protein
MANLPMRYYIPEFIMIGIRKIKSANPLSIIEKPDVLHIIEFLMTILVIRLSSNSMNDQSDVLFLGILITTKIWRLWDFSGQGGKGRLIRSSDIIFIEGENAFTNKIETISNKNLFPDNELSPFLIPSDPISNFESSADIVSSKADSVKRVTSNQKISTRSCSNPDLLVSVLAFQVIDCSDHIIQESDYIEI